jgi:hypothetical protein
MEKSDKNYNTEKVSTILTVYLFKQYWRVFPKTKLVKDSETNEVNIFTYKYPLLRG